MKIDFRFILSLLKIIILSWFVLVRVRVKKRIRVRKTGLGLGLGLEARVRVRVRAGRSSLAYLVRKSATELAQLLMGLGPLGPNPISNCASGVEGFTVEFFTLTAPTH